MSPRSCLCYILQRPWQKYTQLKILSELPLAGKKHWSEQWSGSCASWCSWLSMILVFVLTIGWYLNTIVALKIAVECVKWKSLTVTVDCWCSGFSVVPHSSKGCWELMSPAASSVSRKRGENTFNALAPTDQDWSGDIIAIYAVIYLFKSCLLI